MNRLNEIMATELERGRMFECQGNKFIPYSLCTTDYQRINDAYMKLRLNHAEARHIICAWNNVGVPIYECADGCDDGDHGASEAVLQMMIDNNIKNRTIFIVRNCGQKLYDSRLDCYIKAARQVIREFR